MLNEAVFGIDRRRTLPALSRRTLASQRRDKARADARRPALQRHFHEFLRSGDRPGGVGRSRSRGLESGARAQSLLRTSPDFERPACEERANRRAEYRMRSTKPRPAARSSSSASPVAFRRCAKTRLRCCAAKSSEKAQRRRRSLRPVRRVRRRTAAALETRTAENPAAWPLPSEVHGPAAGGEIAAGENSRLQRLSISMPAAAAWRARSVIRKITSMSRAYRRAAPVPAAARARTASTVVVAAGTSCRHQIHDFTAKAPIHPAVLLRSLMPPDEHRRASRSRRCSSPSSPAASRA